MVYWRVTLLLVLTALPATLSFSFRNSYAPHRQVFACRGLQGQVYAVRDEVASLSALLQNATSGSTTVLENQETLITISDTLIDRRDDVRFVVQDIRREQGENLRATLEAHGRLRDSLLEELGLISGDVTQLQDVQKVLQTTLDETAEDLAARREALDREVCHARRQLQDARELLLRCINDVESLQADVRGLVNLFHGSALAGYASGH